MATRGGAMKLDLVVLFTAGNDNHVAIWRKFRQERLPRYILAAVTAK
ncbi:hypothetical protein HNS30_01365 [Corallococcus exercitus]|uniref:Uncharacterized protein n=1 Tax=Corallococcus exercitus TaxID=2316736 RepID=A0A7Y4JMB4_9BACT|nr:hypothetical protein [Corallococcus exercitus]